MGRRGTKKTRQKIITKPESVTPWWNSRPPTNSAPRRDRRAESDFFAEYSTESLFTHARSTGDLRDPYEVLGLFPGATLAQVKAAHRKLAKQYHPDRFGDAPEAERQRAEARMVLVNAAYAELLARVTASTN